MASSLTAAPAETRALLECRGEGVRFDHVTLAVPDLERAEETFQHELGFAVKPGRRHQNGLENLHLRFRDGSEIELLTLRGAPGDELAAWYRDLLQMGGGGAFVALHAGPIDDRVEAFEDTGETLVVEGPAWDQLSRPLGHPLDVLFLIDVRHRRPDTEAELAHENGALGVREVWITVSDLASAVELLTRLGAASCGKARHAATGQEGLAFALEQGSLVLLETAVPGGSPRILSVEVATVSLERTVRPAGGAGVWLLFSPTGSPASRGAR